MRKLYENVADFIFRRIILVHGCPEKIMTDNGKVFKKTVRAISDKLQIEKPFSRPYRLQTNGLVE